MVDKCVDVSSHVFLTLYHTGNLLIQAESNIQSRNIHFLNCHLQELFTQVYNRAKLLQKLPTLTHKTKTPLRKHTNGKRTSKTYKCFKCDFQCNDIAAFYNHKKRNHSLVARNLAISSSSTHQAAVSTMNHALASSISAPNDAPSTHLADNSLSPLLTGNPSFQEDFLNTDEVSDAAFREADASSSVKDVFVVESPSIPQAEKNCLAFASAHRSHPGGGSLYWRRAWYCFPRG